MRYAVTDAGLNYRETKRREEMEQLLAAGKIPHVVELEKNSERSVAGRLCKLRTKKIMSFNLI